MYKDLNKATYRKILDRIKANSKYLGLQKGLPTYHFLPDYKKEHLDEVFNELESVICEMRRPGLENFARRIASAFLGSAQIYDKQFKANSYEATVKELLALPATHISRFEMVSRMNDLASELAAKHGFELMESQDDRQKGIWGEELTKKLEKEHGPCTQETRWTSATKPGHVLFRFRFASPLIAIQEYSKGGNQVMASVEIGQRYNTGTKESDGDWTIREAMIWDAAYGGESLYHELVKGLRQKNIIK